MNTAPRCRTPFVAGARPRAQSWIASGLLHTGLALAFVLGTVCFANRQLPSNPGSSPTRIRVSMQPVLSALMTSAELRTVFKRDAAVAERTVDEMWDVYTGDGPLPSDHSACSYCICSCCGGGSNVWCRSRDCPAFLEWQRRRYREDLRPLRELGSFVSDKLSDAGLSAVIPK